MRMSMWVDLCVSVSRSICLCMFVLPQIAVRACFEL